MEPQVYQIIIKTTLRRNGKEIVSFTEPTYSFTTEEHILKYADSINSEFITFESACEAIDNGVIPQPFMVTENLFGKERITHYNIFREPLHTSRKQFGGIKKQLYYYEYDSTIKDYSEKLSADDFIDYCMSKGLGERWLNI